MRHLGDITRLRGDAIPPVDVVIGGSPCQDLSTAGRRAGLAGARSGLFMEQIRVVKELRKASEQSGRTGESVQPRYMVWENVTGAFSSNGGADFQSVLEETARIADPDAVIPGPPGRQGRWRPAGIVLGDGWSVAWRVLDAQFWGVPQRRRRISLVADFGGESAPEILFERNRVQGDSGTDRAEGPQAAPSGTESSACPAGGGLRLYENHAIAARYEGPLDVCPCLTRHDGTGGNNLSLVLNSQGESRAGTDTPRAEEHGYKPLVMASAQSQAEISRDLSATLLSAGPPLVSMPEVRRLTPMECERLQGFPDGWTDIGPWVDSLGRARETSDTARYRALGNSIALPPWTWVLRRLSAVYQKPAALGSLFDGISGFPLIWERINGRGTCLWTSEIEEFPMAVCRYHFGNEETGETGDFGVSVF